MCEVSPCRVCTASFQEMRQPSRQNMSKLVLTAAEGVCRRKQADLKDAQLRAQPYMADVLAPAVSGQKLAAARVCCFAEAHFGSGEDFGMNGFRVLVGLDSKIASRSCCQLLLPSYLGHKHTVLLQRPADVELFLFQFCRPSTNPTILGVALIIGHHAFKAPPAKKQPLTPLQRSRKGTRFSLAPFCILHRTPNLRLEVPTIFRSRAEG